MSTFNKVLRRQEEVLKNYIVMAKYLKRKKNNENNPRKDLKMQNKI